VPIGPGSVELGWRMLNEPKQSWRGHPVWRHAGIFAICAALVAGAIVAASTQARAAITPAPTTMSTRAAARTTATASTKRHTVLAAAVTHHGRLEQLRLHLHGSGHLWDTGKSGRHGRKSGGHGQWPFGRPEFQHGPVDPDDVVRRGDRVMNTDPTWRWTMTDSESTYDPCPLVVDDSDVVGVRCVNAGSQTPGPIAGREIRCRSSPRCRTASAGEVSMDGFAVRTAG